MARKKKKEAEGPKNEWMATYSDMITLLLCFFAILFNPDEANPTILTQIAASAQLGGTGSNAGGNTLSAGRYADLGNMINSLPATDRGKSLGTALRKAVSLFSPEVRSNKVKITSDERGVVITLASDAFFEPASANLNMEASRTVLLRLAQLLSSEEAAGRKFRIEGHTDTTPIDPEGPWESNWQLSAMRSISVLQYLTAANVPETRFQVAGFAGTMPVSRNNTAEGRANNRRVEIIILDEAHW
ncbi:MAG: flagellar motor protein MotB [Spirochaetaceae bacterium]|jgi:chemotaxis protein MotB|nr:flagellar motor protein MotB [Spirochaetaceae bacterium]